MYTYFISWIAPAHQEFGQCCYNTDRRIRTEKDVMEMRRYVMANEAKEVIILNFICLEGGI